MKKEQNMKKVEVVGVKLDLVRNRGYTFDSFMLSGC